MTLAKKTFLPFLVLLTAFSLAACFNDNESLNKSGMIKQDEGADVGEQGYPEAEAKFYFRASPKITDISLSWLPVAGATDYEVFRKLEGQAVVTSRTDGAVSFSFTTGEQETYEVWVTALDSSGEVLELSNKMFVTTGSSQALLLSDEGL